MDGALAAPCTILLEFNLPGRQLFVAAGVVIAPFADGTAQAYEIVGVFGFCHGGT